MAALGAIGYDLSTRQVEPQTGPSLTISAGRTFGTCTSKLFTPAPGALLGVMVPYVMATTDGTIYTVSGTTSVLSSATSGITVRVFRRDNGALLGTTVSGGSGVWSIKTPYNGAVTAIAYDTGSTYNAIVYDQVIPA